MISTLPWTAPVLWRFRIGMSPDLAAARPEIQSARGLAHSKMPRWVLTSLMHVLVADDDFGGLHAFRVDLLGQNLARAHPTQVHQFAGDRAGVREGVEDLVGHVALVSIEAEIVTFLEQGDIAF